MIHAGIPWIADGYKENAAKRISPSGSVVESIDNVKDFEDYGIGAEKYGKRRVQSANDSSRLSGNYALSQDRYCRTRPKSTSTRQQLRTSRTMVQPPSRPQSAQAPPKRPMSGLPSRRIKSAGTEGRSAGDLKKSYTMVIRTYEHGKFQSAINANPDCRYFDRHARCFDHTHLHSKLIWKRPQKPCRVGGWCGPPTERDLDEYIEMQRIASSGMKTPDDSWEVELDERQMRYVASMRPWTSATRPRTAPTTVR